jgi:hypothetical protein
MSSTNGLVCCIFEFFNCKRIGRMVMSDV